MILPIVLSTVVSCSSTASKSLNLDRLDLTTKNVAANTNLMTAAKNGHVSAIKNALLAGDLVNSVSADGTAFSMAMKAKHQGIAELLLKAGAHWQPGFEADQPTALMLAAKTGNNSLVKNLILKGAALNTIDKRGYSALANAAVGRHLTTMKILINAGADVNVSPDGLSVLMHVVEDNNTLLSQLLIAAGSDVNYRNEDGDTALKMARRKGYFDLDLMLVQAGARL